MIAKKKVVTTLSKPQHNINFDISWVSQENYFRNRSIPKSPSQPTKLNIIGTATTMKITIYYWQQPKKTTTIVKEPTN